MNRVEFRSSKDPHALLKAEILRRLRLSDVDEDDLMKLVILSVKLQTLGVSEEKLLNSVEKYDCHQTGLVAKKKALLLLGMEKDLDVHLDDDRAVNAKTVDDLCQLFLQEMQEGSGA